MKKKWIRAAGVLAAALCLLLALQMLAGAAGPCSLTVYPCDPAKSEEMKDLLEPAPDGSSSLLVFDLYKVADMSRSPSFDTYDFTPAEDFPEVEIQDDITSEGWREIAQNAAEKIFWQDGKLRDVLEMEPVKRDMPLGGETQCTGLEPGVYLVIAHKLGEDYKDYVTEKAGSLVTQFQGSQNLYTFIPEVITLPSKEADENGVINTANPGEWLEDVTIYLKPGVNDALGSITITKNLRSFAGKANTFVFHVKATRDGKLVYDKVVSLDFTEAGTKNLTLTDLPVGSVVTVEEIYSGASCTLVPEGCSSPADPTVTLEEILEFVFTNDMDGPNQGHGIQNHFTYGPDEDGKLGWHLTKSEINGGGET